MADSTNFYKEIIMENIGDQRAVSLDSWEDFINDDLETFTNTNNENFEAEEETFPTSRPENFETEEETFPTSRPENPPKMERRTKHKARRNPNDLQEIMSNVMKCLNFDEFISPSSEPQVTTQVIRLDYLGQLLRFLLLGLIDVVLFIVNKIGARVPMIMPSIGIVNLTKRDIIEGQWNDLLCIPDNYVKSFNITGLHAIVDIVSEFLYHVLKYNRISIPLLAFYIGTYFG